MRAPAWLVALVLIGAAPTIHAAPPSDEQDSDDRGRIEGRVRAEGLRTPLADVEVMVVAAPADARPGRRARDALDPAEVTWIRETRTDEQGAFAIDDLPVGKVRVVILASGHRRMEIYAEVRRDRSERLELFVEPDPRSAYRTEVISEQRDERPEVAQPEHRLDAEQARVYPGSGGDPVRAAQNLPGVARSPGGLGMVAMRGGDPRQTGVYLDGHPIPRGFHVLPIASVVAPGMTKSVELTPGNYDAAFGGHAAGLLHIYTRPGPVLDGRDERRAIHGEAHLDLFDFGTTIAGPVGPGAVTFGFRRSHVGNVIETVDKILPEDLGILIPNYWDYLGRFDMPVAKHHRLTLRVLGAGDNLRDVPRLANFSDSYIPGTLDFRAAFHRIDLAHEFERGRWRTSISPALRLDSGALDLGRPIERHAMVASLRASVSYALSRRATLMAGLDLVDEHWRRRNFEYALDPLNPMDVVQVPVDTRGRDLALGTWLGVALRFDPRPGPLIVRMQVRLSLFSDGREARLMPDPRADLRFRVHPRVEILAALGQYSFPVVVQDSDQAGIATPDSQLPYYQSYLDIPPWLIAYFDPGLEGEVSQGSLMLGRTTQASTGARVELPWQLGLKGTLFWREGGAQSRRYPDDRVHTGFGVAQLPHTRAYGLELMLDRALARDIHGWIGYTLLRSQKYSDELGKWQPADFDQRHNLVALVSFGLPRNFRFGVRFRLVSGNPERPIYGSIIRENGIETHYRPIAGEFGDSYRQLFHQLDLRVDKTWYRKRASFTAYVDIQNVYNKRYPELWLYAADFRERSERIGVPIFPSIGIRVDY